MDIERASQIFNALKDKGNFFRFGEVDLDPRDVQEAFEEFHWGGSAEFIDGLDGESPFIVSSEKQGSKISEIEVMEPRFLEIEKGLVAWAREREKVFLDDETFNEALREVFDELGCDQSLFATIMPPT